MGIQLSDQQRADAQVSSVAPVRVSDPARRTTFVLVRAKVYECFKSLFKEDPLTEQERVAHLEQFGRRAGWDDPETNVYDGLDPRPRT